MIDANLIGKQSHKESSRFESFKDPADQFFIGTLRENKDVSFTYYNTNEIPGELSRENVISSHVKILPLLWLHNKLRFSHQNYLSEMVWYFIGVFKINRTLYGRLEIPFQVFQDLRLSCHFQKCSQFFSFGGIF